jgi:hypothetical protein
MWWKLFQREWFDTLDDTPPFAASAEHTPGYGENGLAKPCPSQEGIWLGA